MVASKPTAEHPWPQHQDPLLLWPVLATLSILLHLGLLALALPFIIRIVRPAATETKTVTVPVELLELDEQALSPQPTTTAAPDTTPASDQSTESDTPQDGDATQLDPNASNASPSGSDSSETEDNSRSTEAPSEGNTPVPSSDSANESEPRAPTPEETSSPAAGDSTNEGRSQPGSREGINGSTNGSPQDVQPLPDLGPEDLDPPQPNEQLNPEREVFVRFGSLSQLPANAVSDLPDSPPQFPPSSNQSREISLSHHNCPGKVPTTSQDFDIQVIINRAGVIESATILGTPFQNNTLKEDEAFAVCLVLESDFRFIPARSGGAPALTDAYYLAVTVTPANP